MNHSILQKLFGGDRRSIGRAEEVAAEVLRRLALLGALVYGLTSKDLVVRMRSADALEKVTRDRPRLLTPHKRALLKIAANTDQQEVRWHLGSALPRMELRSHERAAAADIRFEHLRDNSSIVKTCAMQGLADLAVRDARSRPQTADANEQPVTSMQAWRGVDIPVKFQAMTFDRL
jgi:hypothetical protein